LLTALAISWTNSVPASAHGGGAANLGEVPITFAAGVRMLRDERAGIDSSRISGDLADLSWRATRLSTLAAAVASLAEATGILAAPALSEVSRATDSLLAVAAELLEAAGRRDPGRLARAVWRLAP